MRVLLAVVVLFGVGLVSLETVAAEQKKFPGVKALMSDDELEQTGVSKLTDTERKALNDWLVRYTVTDAKVIRRTNKEVIKAEKDTKIMANITQPFDGWKGKTVFRLDNGQTWQQRIAGKHRFKGKNTAIVIKKNMFGFYVMTLVETGRSVGVKPI